VRALKGKASGLPRSPAASISAGHQSIASCIRPKRDGERIAGIWPRPNRHPHEGEPGLGPAATQHMDSRPAKTVGALRDWVRGCAFASCEG
jgi:hypothetical protein